MEETFFLFSVNGFPKGGERYFFQNFLTLFLFFFTKKFIFLQKQWGGIYREVRKMRAWCSVSWYTTPSLPFLPPYQVVMSFFRFLICATVWRSFRGPFLSFICLESSRCIISNGPKFARFGVTIVKISHPKKRWRGAKNSVTIFLKKICIIQTGANIIKPFLWEVMKTLCFKLVQPDHFNSCPIGTIYCANLAQKLHLFP